MKKIAVVGAGAFGTSLAIALAREGADVLLWARNPDHVRQMKETRRNEARLPGVDLPDGVTVSAEAGDIAMADIVLLAVPMQQIGHFLQQKSEILDGKPLVACCKGIELKTLLGPTSRIAQACPRSVAAILTGPSFAADIARGLPTALTLACADMDTGAQLQEALSTPVLRLYRTTDVTGAELGGALKNVIAIAAGVVIGAGLGDSARAALIARGYAEMALLVSALGARAETLAGLSGLGDLVLTCTSEQSRNFRYGRAIGAGERFDPTVTVEGATTATAVAALAETKGIDMPITRMVSAVIAGKLTVAEAVPLLMTRPLKQE